MGVIETVFSSKAFMPHGHCYLWLPDVLWTHVISDSLVALAYFSIPVALGTFNRRRRDIVYPWVLWLFVAFIFACGMTHAMAVWTTWTPAYRLSGLVKALTAVVSLPTAVVLWPVVARAAQLPSAAALRAANAQLADEVRRRRRAEAQLRELNRTLEARIAERTEELARSRRFFQDLYDNAPDMMMSVGAETEDIIECNRRCTDAIGLPRPELVGRSLFDVFHASCHGSLRQVLAEVRAGGTPSEKAELLLLKKDGEPLDVTLSGSVVELDGDHTERHTRISLRDVSEARGAQRALTRVRVSLAEKQEEVEQLIYTVSHDLKSPVVTCSGFISLCIDSLNQGDVKGATDAADRVQTACARMAQLLDDLLQLSRAGHDLDFDDVDTMDLFLDLHQEYEPRLRNEGIELVAGCPLPTLWTDRRSLRLILDNYLTNAFKYGRSDRVLRVEVGGESDPGGVRLFVRDNGPGIADSYHERVFELFQRLQPGETEGTGLGLALVRKLARVLGGRVWVESAVGRGSTFFIELPRDALRVGGTAPASGAGAET